MNGDRIPDLIVGAYNYVQQLPHLALAGEDKPTNGYVRVLSGKDGSVIHTFHGESKGHGFGIAVANAGDVNRDGHSDILVGSPYLSARAIFSPLRRRKPGLAYVYSGKDGSLLATVKEETAEGSFGGSVCGVGDLNGDGHADIAVGCTLLHPNNGSIVVYSGRDWNVLFRFDGKEGDKGFGSSVRSAGDVDEDGVSDIIVGGPDADKGARDAGVVKVFSGKSGEALHVWRGQDTFASLGSSVAGIGDVDGDGKSDLLVCARGLDQNGANAGGAFVYSGGDGSILYMVGGPTKGTEFGIDSCELGDVDGDEVPDFAVAAHRSGGGSSNRTRVFSGSNGSLLFECPGMAVASVGDVDQDGFTDLATGVWTVDLSDGQGQAGVVRVFSVAKEIRSVNRGR